MTAINSRDMILELFSNYHSLCKMQCMQLSIRCVFYITVDVSTYGHNTPVFPMYRVAV